MTPHLHHLEKELLEARRSTARQLQTYRRQNGESEALIGILQQGEDEVSQGKVKPAAAVVKRLRTDRQSVRHKAALGYH